MMDKRTRAQVVELLRCAADCYARTSSTMWFDTVAFIYGADPWITELARRAAVSVQDEPSFDLERVDASRRGLSVMPNEWGVRAALEAAQRVESGEWP